MAWAVFLEGSDVVIKKGRRSKKSEGASRQAPVFFSTLCGITGAVMVVPVPAPVAQRYVSLHQILPEDLSAWPERVLDEIVEDLDGGDVDCWERALILLAHHRSQKATSLLRELAPQIPQELKGFFELAFAESLGWLGYSYIREAPDERPTIHRVSET